MRAAAPDSREALLDACIRRHTTTGAGPVKRGTPLALEETQRRLREHRREKNEDLRQRKRHGAERKKRDAEDIRREHQPSNRWFVSSAEKRQVDEAKKDDREATPDEEKRSRGDPLAASLPSKRDMHDAKTHDEVRAERVGTTHAMHVRVVTPTRTAVMCQKSRSQNVPSGTWIRARR
jgi:hypothetical protein